MKYNMKIKKVVIIIGQGTDIIMITPDINTSFPDMKIETTFKLEAQAGYGKEWCEKELGITPEIINIRQ